MKNIVISQVVFLLIIFSSQAKENLNKNSHRQSDRTAVSCTPSTANRDLNIGNVRARILMNGDMWWDLVGNPRYEVPKNSGKHSFFAGGLWIGGKELGGNLKVAAQTYRQSGSDFWPGPLDTINATVSASVCLQYNRQWRITRQEVANFIGGGAATTDIQQWPGNGDASYNQAHYLAPFVDVNGDGIYSTQDGDYPDYDNSSGGSGNCCNNLHGDQTIWWVFNDAGDIHTETGGASIGLEIQAQAFAYNTVTALNNATLYQYKIINRSSFELDSTYIGQWIDPDLGNYLDDFVGCDVARGMGYCYNGDTNDEGTTGYGLFPPAIGVDFLQGPQADLHDGIDNDRDSCIDCTWIYNGGGPPVAVSDTFLPELIIMSKFIYYNNDGSSIGNPNNASDYYNYLKGIWRDGNRITYGGNGHGTGNGATATPCDFMFPGISDPSGWGTNHVSQAPWDETTAGNAPDDRRFLQSAGSFTFSPGEVLCITTAVVWARTQSGSPFTSLDLLQQADDEIQQYFNSCFSLYPVSVNDIARISNSISVYPNPFHDYTTLNFSELNKHNLAVDIELYDMKGTIVRTYKNIKENIFTMKRDGLKSGSYLFRITSNGMEIKTAKLLVVD